MHAHTGLKKQYGYFRGSSQTHPSSAEMMASKFGPHNILFIFVFLQKNTPWVPITLPDVCIHEIFIRIINTWIWGPYNVSSKSMIKEKKKMITARQFMI